MVKAKVYGREFKALIDSGATKYLITLECCTAIGLAVSSHDLFLKVGTRELALYSGLMHQTPIVVTSVRRKVNLTLSKLMHDVDLILEINYLELQHPLIDWCSSKIHLPNAVYNPHLKGS